MVRPLSLAQHTLYADLLEQGGDDLFDPDMPENGSLLVRPNRAGAQADHVYYQGYRTAAGNLRPGQWKQLSQRDLEQLVSTESGGKKRS